MRVPLLDLWKSVLNQFTRPAVQQEGPVDAIVRLLKNEDVTRIQEASKGARRRTAV